jgi:hypothetical protein
MLDAVIRGANCLRRNIEFLRESFRDSRELAHHFQSLESKARHAQGVQKFCPEARPRIARDGDVVDFANGDARGVQAVADGRRRKSRRVLHTIEALFLDGGDQAAVRDNGRGGVAVVGIDSKDEHPEWFFPSLRPRVRGSC